MCPPPIPPTNPEGECAKRARLTRDADSRCTLAGGPQPLLLFVVTKAQAQAVHPRKASAQSVRFTCYADSWYTLAGGPQPLSLFVVMLPTYWISKI